MHYFSLAGFVWILLEAFMLYLKLIVVYNGEFVRMKNFLLFGWGMFSVCKDNDNLEFERYSFSVSELFHQHKLEPKNKSIHFAICFRNGNGKVFFYLD